MTLDTTQIDARQFNRMLRDLSFITGRDFKGVVDSEAKAALRRTRAAKVKNIRGRFERQLFHRHGGRTYKLTNRLPGGVWRAIQAERRATLRGRLKRRGMGKRSWMEVGMNYREAVERAARDALAAQGLTARRSGRRGRRHHRELLTNYGCKST